MRIQTKEQRTEIRTAQFNRLIQAGYTREDYKTLQIFTHPTELLLQIFKGTSTNPLTYTRFRTTSRMQEVVKQYKDGADRSEIWKAEQKERNKGKSSSHAATAAAIKAELKAAFPNCKFSVTSDSYSQGDATRIHWTDGPTVNEVENISQKYQYGHFDGMTDSYESSNSRDDIPQVKFVSESRSISDSIEQEVSSQLSKLMNFDSRDLEDTTRRVISKTAIPHQYTAIRVCRNDQTAGSGWDSFFYLEFEGAPQQTQEETRPAAPQIAPDQITVIKYSEKAIAVIGSTKPIKDALKELGGSFNPRLSCGAGWIFPASKQSQVIEMLKKQKEAQPTAQPTQEPEITINDSDIIPAPATNTLKLDTFTIIWHEGKQNPNFEGVAFTDWNEVQKAFFTLWTHNEKGNDGGYTKVKCTIKLEDEEAETCRIDITNRINNGDFNPSKENIVSYIVNNLYEPEETEKEGTLQEEIQKTTNSNIQIYGQLQPCTMQIVRVQKGESANV